VQLQLQLCIAPRASGLQDPSVDELRLEHVWVLLTGEIVRAAASVLTGEKLQLLVQHMGLMLGDRLASLCEFYDNYREQMELNAMAESLRAINERPKADAAENLWQVDGDDVRPPIKLLCLEMSPAARSQTVLCPQKHMT
jgi:hypothetical protein